MFPAAINIIDLFINCFNILSFFYKKLIKNTNTFEEVELDENESIYIEENDYKRNESLRGNDVLYYANPFNTVETYSEEDVKEISSNGKYRTVTVKNISEVIDVITSGFTEKNLVDKNSKCWVVKDNKVVWGTKIICVSNQANDFRKFVIGTQSSPKRMLQLASFFTANIVNITFHEWGSFTKKNVNKKHILFPDDTGNFKFSIPGTYVHWM